MHEVLSENRSSDASRPINQMIRTLELNDWAYQALISSAKQTFPSSVIGNAPGIQKYKTGSWQDRSLLGPPDDET